MCEKLTDAENRTPLISAPQNEEAADTAAQKPSFFAHPAEKWALPAALWLGYLYCRMLFGDNGYLWPFHIHIGFGEEGIWFYCMPLLLTLCFAAGLIAFCRWRGIRGSKESPVWLICLLTTAFAAGADRLNAAGWFGGWVAFHFFAVVWTAARTGQLSENRTGAAFVPDLFRCIGYGFAGLAAWPQGVWAWFCQRPRRPRRKNRDTVPILLCIGAAAVLLMMAASLLSSADDRFGDLLQSAVDALVFWKGFSLDWTVVISLFFAFFVGPFFYGMTVAGHRALAEHPRPALTSYAEKLTPMRRVPVGALCGVLAAFAVLYLIFFGVQGGYLFGAFTGRLPEGFTVANYARQGFFELCRVVVLNFVLLAAMELFARRPLQGCRPLQGAAAVLLAQSLLLWVTAASKLGLYIVTFGFTAKRLLAAWALLVLAAAAVRWLGRLGGRCSVLRPTVLIGAVSFALLCLY